MARAVPPAPRPRARVPGASREAVASPPTEPAYHAQAPQGGEDLPSAPSRAEVLEAMQSVAVVVRACGSGAEPATVDVTFASSGRVTTATVRAPYAGTPTGSCIARAVRAARLGPFAQPSFHVAYPFTLQ